MKAKANIRTKKDIKEDKKILLIFLRYLILLCSMFSLFIIYQIFTPLTLYPVKFLLSIFHDVFLYKDLLIVNLEIFIKIIPSCIAGSAYLLLLILNLTTSMNLKKRIFSILVSFSFLLILNILRIFILSMLYISNANAFNFTHKLFWYFLSSIFVVGIWFLTNKLFALKKIPICSDIRFLLKNIKNKKSKS